MIIYRAFLSALCQFFGSGHEPARLNHPGIARDGIGRGTVCTVLHGMGLSHHGMHGTIRTGHGYARYSTGRDLTGRGRYGTLRDGIKPSRDCTGRY